MMQGNGKQPALKLNVMIFHPSYGGNGGISSEHPDIRNWEVRTVMEMKADPRVGEVVEKTIADTPITMVRNRAVQLARQEGAHLLLMMDSDQSPDKHAGEPWYKPFWQVAFDEVYAHYSKGPLVIGAPYCGPPGCENVYVFQFHDYGSYGDETNFSLEQYTRAEAARMSGVSEVAALPTGMILFDMRIFDILEPSSLNKGEILDKLLAGEMTKVDALHALEDGWFFYEWRDQYAAEKGSTEDVASTRNMAFVGIQKLGYNPLRCAWDSWIGHHKPWCVGRPQKLVVENIAANFRHAVENDYSLSDTLVDFKTDSPIKVDHVAPPAVPTGFPRELLERIPDASKASTRFINDREVLSLGHQTPDGHLDALRNLVRHENERIGRLLEVVEVGSWMGESACAIADFCDSITCVDNWVGPELNGSRVPESADVYRDIFLWNVRNDHVSVMQDSSVSAAQECIRSGFKFDVVIIDADHSYESTKQDIESWMNVLRDGGLMIGHDYNTRQFPGVDRAVDELFEEIRTCGGETKMGEYWVARKEAYRGIHH